MKKKWVLDKILESSAFENRILNKIVVQLEDALPARSFNYAQHGIKLFLHTWAALEAHKLYINLQDKVLSNLIVCFFLILILKFKFVLLQLIFDYSLCNLVT